MVHKLHIKIPSISKTKFKHYQGLKSLAHVREREREREREHWPDWMIASVNHRKHTFKLSMLAVANTASNSPHPPTAKDRNPVAWIAQLCRSCWREERERKLKKSQQLGGKPSQCRPHLSPSLSSFPLWILPTFCENFMFFCKLQVLSILSTPWPFPRHPTSGSACP